MEVTGQLQVPAALLPGEEPSVPNEQEVGSALQPIWMRWRRAKNLCPWRESNSGHPARSIVTKLRTSVQINIFETFHVILSDRKERQYESLNFHSCS